MSLIREKCNRNKRLKLSNRPNQAILNLKK